MDRGRKTRKKKRTKPIGIGKERVEKEGGQTLKRGVEGERRKYGKKTVADRRHFLLFRRREKSGKKGKNCEREGSSKSH